MEGSRSAAEVQVLRNLDEGPQLAEFHR